MMDEKISKKIFFVSFFITLLIFILIFGLLMVDKINYSDIEQNANLLTILNTKNEKSINFRVLSGNYKLDLAAGYKIINDISKQVYNLSNYIWDLINENLF